MQTTDTGKHCVIWLSTDGGTSPALAYAFFHIKAQAEAYANKVGGDLYVKNDDGSLKRA